MFQVTEPYLETVASVLFKPYYRKGFGAIDPESKSMVPAGLGNNVPVPEVSGNSRVKTTRSNARNSNGV